MAKEFSPEQKLLDLIKRKKGAHVPPKSDAGTSASIGMASESKKGGLSSRPSLDLRNIIRIENIKFLNAALFFTLVAIILYFLIDIFLIPSKEIARLEEEMVEKAPAKIKEVEIEPYSYYSKELASKEIFKPLVKEEEKELRPEIPPEELIGNLSLLGIVSGEHPQAIIEDKKQKKSFFLREGQSAGGIFLKRIDDDSITVIYRGEEFNLTL